MKRGDLTKNCCFDDGRKCLILCRRDCDGCKFKKTWFEFNAAQAAAEKYLADRGLEAARVETTEGAIVTVVERE